MLTLEKIEDVANHINKFNAKQAQDVADAGRLAMKFMLGHFTDLGYEKVAYDEDGFYFKLPEKFKYTDENPYISTGMSKETEKGKKYTGMEADVAEFYDTFVGRV